jgi:F-type H+-transporting ATPase subunit delta
MSVALSSRRYAQAVFQIAAEKNNYDNWQKSLKEISELLLNPDFARVLDNPKIRFEQKEKIIKSALHNADPLAINLALLLVIKNKFNSAGQIAEEYGRLCDEAKGIKRAQFTTAIELAQNEKNNALALLESLTGYKLSMEFNIDASIIGGFIARINGTLIDGSIRSKLDQLRDQISKKGK